MKRKMPVRTATLNFIDDGYPDFHCETWINTPIAYIRRYSALNAEADVEEANDLLLKLFPSWDFVDFDGKAIPHTAKGTDMIPSELGAAMMKRRAEALQNGAMPGPLETESSEPPSEEEKG
jgi:hypothetical protein